MPARTGQTGPSDGRGAATGDSGDELDIAIEDITGDGSVRGAEATVVDRPPQIESALAREIDDVIRQLDAKRSALEKSIGDARQECQISEGRVEDAEADQKRAQAEFEKAKLETAKIEAEKVTLTALKALLFEQPDLSVQVALKALRGDREDALGKEETRLAELVKARDKAYTEYIDANNARQDAMTGRRLTSEQLITFGLHVDEALRTYRGAEAIEKTKLDEVDALKALVKRLRELCNQGDAREQDVLGELGKVQTRLQGALDVQQTKQTNLETADSNVARAKVDLQDHEDALQELEGNLEKLVALSRVLGQAYEMTSRGEDAMRTSQALSTRLAAVHSQYAETDRGLSEQTGQVLQVAQGVQRAVSQSLREGAGKTAGLQTVLETHRGTLSEVLERLGRSVDVFTSADSPESEEEFAKGILEIVMVIKELCRPPLDMEGIASTERDVDEMARICTDQVAGIDPAALRREVGARDGLVATNRRLGVDLLERDKRIEVLEQENRDGAGKLAEATSANVDLKQRIGEIEGAERNLAALLEAAGVETAAELRGAIETIRDASRGFDGTRKPPSMQAIAGGLATSMRRAAPDRSAPEDAGSS